MLSILLLLSFLTVGFTVLAGHSQTPSFSLPKAPQGFAYKGSLNPDNKVMFAIYIPLKNFDELYSYALAVSQLGNPLYHKFLTKSQVQQFYPKTQFDKIMSQLNSDGFKVIYTAADSVIVGEGTVSQIEKDLGVSFAVYSNGTTSYYVTYGQPTVNAFVYSSNISDIFFSHPSTLITKHDIQKLSQEVNQTAPIEAYWPTALQKVYNATYLYSLGDMGQGKTIGILDFYGDPYIFQQLAYFDKVTGLPSTNFTVYPIGPYNPSLGIEKGWAGEISLDVEASHSIAPKANITLFIANPNLPLSAVIACIDSLDNVNTVSQSFSIPESSFSTFNGPLFYSCVVLTDEYYALGSAEGITFLASSGDAGGQGYSNGPLGTVGYPADSPFVTAVGGTTTYISFPEQEYYQTAWSNYGFIPNDANYGGSTGGVSEIEPKPWYQWNLKTPFSYPSGKLLPDISANANVYPGIDIICPGNITSIIGGTSEASPLTAGMVVLIDSYLNTSLGMLNPLLYDLANVDYGKAITPITFGYNIPWTASYGYNLVTGWGTINVGEFALDAKQVTSTAPTSLDISVVLQNDTGKTPLEFCPGQTMYIEASISYNKLPVTSGTFNAIIESTQGNISEISLKYSSINGMWGGNVTLPSDAQGILYIYVTGSSDGISGLGWAETFSGYFITFISPQTFVPTYAQLGNDYIEASITNVYGMPSLSPTISVMLYSYNITTNTILPIKELTLQFNQKLGIYVGVLPNTTSVGNDMLEGINAFGFVSFTNGIYLQNLFILPPVIAEPGSVAPGQQVIIKGSIQCPLNLAMISPSTAEDLLFGTNITAYLVNSQGKVISKALIPLNSSGIFLGYLNIPTSAPQGLYTVLLKASYDSLSLNTYVNGSFYGQIYVSPYSSVQVSSTKYAYEGQTVYVYANITSGGSPVKYGMYSAVVYPTVLSSEYSLLSIEIEVPLWYNPAIGEWVGNFTTPSVVSEGSLQGLFLGLYDGAPFDILVTGVSAMSNPTTTSLSAAHVFYVMPYLLTEGKTITDPLTYYSAFVNDTIEVNGTYSNDVFVNDTFIDSNIRFIDSNVTNAIFKNSDISLYQVNAYNLTFYNSTVYLFSSSAKDIKLINSVIVPSQSLLQDVYPTLPSISIIAPTGNLTGTINVKVSVIGQEVQKTIVYLNGMPIFSFTNGTQVISINTAKYPDGTYNLTVFSLQSDGLHSSNVTYLNFENSISSLSSNLSNVSSNVSSLSSKESSLSREVSNVNATANSDISSLKGNLSSSISSINNEVDSVKSYAIDLAIVAIVLAIVGIALAILAIRRR
ncbi:peptidase S53 [Candidatus Acidianus copahuensis]|uniref:Peptidase S53 n=1 Tax=Candidatus Acidianus copahuensis TaxID=1160895 RepID=A0A031LRK7_9CREN|nr:peptidase S53 [Candidatus Acidianus copahuensis]